MFDKIRNNSKGIINWGLLALLAVNILDIITMRSFGTSIVPKLQVEKVYTIIVIILLSIILLFIIIELIVNKLPGKKVFFLILLMLHAYILWPHSDRMTVTLKNNSGMELMDITITDPNKDATISHLEVDGTLTIPATLNAEGGTLRIQGKLGSGKTFDSATGLINELYITDDLDILIDSSGSVEFKWISHNPDYLEKYNQGEA